jgi:uncharacterized protein (DUF1810 family)
MSTGKAFQGREPVRHSLHDSGTSCTRFHGLAAVPGSGSPAVAGAGARVAFRWLSRLGSIRVASYDLERFVSAQNAGGTYETAMAELRSGRKRGHWMWFVFPQIAGLGRSPMARTYAISSLAEAEAYLSHPILGPRLVGAARILIGLQGRRPEEIFDGIDATKLRSSMTLFARADPSEPVFPEVLDAYFGGVADAATDNLIAAHDA